MITIKKQNIFFRKNTLNIGAITFIAIYFLALISNIINFGKSYSNTKLFLQQNNLDKNNHAALLISVLQQANNQIVGVSYIDKGEMLDRQINNNNLQTFIDDAKGSVLKLNDFTDASSNKIYPYDAYGNIIYNSLTLREHDILHSNHATTIPNQFQYNGERFDSNTALQYLRARFYHPEIKRFVNQDPYDLLNKFGYVDGNPIINTDPSGNMLEPASSFFRTIKTIDSFDTTNLAFYRSRATIASAPVTITLTAALTTPLPSTPTTPRTPRTTPTKDYLMAQLENFGATPGNSTKLESVATPERNKILNDALGVSPTTPNRNIMRIDGLAGLLSPERPNQFSPSVGGHYPHTGYGTTLNIPGRRHKIIIHFHDANPLHHIDGRTTVRIQDGHKYFGSDGQWHKEPRSNRSPNYQNFIELTHIEVHPYDAIKYDDPEGALLFMRTLFPGII